MEKLQAAIENARQRRAASGTTSPSGSGVGRSQQTVESSSASELWGSIKEITVSPKLARRSRLFLDGRSAEATHFDKLRTKIIQQCRDNGWRRVLVTSATKGCGKTTTCANLATSFARQTDRRLMVLDLDMRRPDLKRALGISQPKGFSEVLEGKVAFEEQAVRLGESVIVSANQNVHPNPGQLILQDKTTDILNDIDQRFSPDIIIFDTPPLLSTDDTLGLVKQVDCAIIIAGAEMSTVPQVD